MANILDLFDLEQFFNFHHIPQENVQQSLAMSPEAYNCRNPQVHNTCKPKGVRLGWVNRTIEGGFKMANVLITGAARGIGQELVRQYAANGDRVYACCRNPGGADVLNGMAAESGGLISVHDMDVGSEDSINACASEIGGVALDIVINNAGVVGGMHQAMGDMIVDDWIDAFRVNTIGPFLVAQAFHSNLKAADTGKIMTVTSQLGATTWPMGGMHSYSSSKGAVNRVMIGVAMDWADDGISVALVHPGYVQTDMGGPAAEITPEESASGIRSVIDGMSMDNSGSFYKWNGEIHAW
jgi:NAD(P)-dependent dehydrogenase (short-subunit alcohol dehydrogenase family)